MALQLAVREDFVPLHTFATVRLGLKTGADGFFFVERLPNPSTGGELLSRRGIILVEGQDGWRGEIASADLRPAILNPHQLFAGDTRLFAISKDTKHLYLCPQSGRLRHGLAEYVRLGELIGIHQGELVQSNGSDAGWYVQVRSLVTSEWVLPYNSAYDYGAWHNPHAAVLNGRFVGAEPIDKNNSELIGAVLNSTFAAMGRLIEGVATGVEGAFDVGPPAARKIKVPDIRLFDEQGRKLVLAAFEAIRENGEMLPCPSRTGNVLQLRRDLDSSLLVALGMSRGLAAAFLDPLYASYGRWRGNIEDVEAQRRVNRRQMNVTGLNRNQRPAETAGKRVWEELEHLVSLFPRAFLPKEEILELVNIPAGASIQVSRPLFEEGTIRTKTKAADLKSYERVLYVSMLRQLGLVGNIEVPTSATKAAAIVELFEKDQLRFNDLASENAAKYVSGKEAISEVIEIARRHWFQACRKNALAGQKTVKPSRKLN
ncbi:hypothetical protein EN974_17980 [Mesorhizobium sp. M7A.F.Ca.CA.001.12.2.1]|uniref:hypothetical protein n=1 Tax=Mesorhizobium sp. M7A.F.Ca.CA.001.12.2.1 TaxID=2496725 RepID=UPI000FCB43E1|nr:hypothetical protein [Mesorhizobium sp. M7A.F.Ca.CA.001.12.2.1]RUY97225.1 hypothetical protein EN974_17980 [Mesorhizobium sp. M7A.F.Ca.CA.001.12.2.1]